MIILFDIGGTHMRVARAGRNVLEASERAQTPKHPREGVRTLVALMEHVSKGKKVERIVGGIAGVISSSGKIEYSPNLNAWNGFALGRNLHNKFKTEISIHNDADLGGLGEARYGAGKGERIVSYLTIGTGVGGTNIVDKKLAAHAYGFEPGHQLIDVITGTTLESVIGGAALTKRYGKPPYELPRAVFNRLTPVLAAGIWNAIVHWSPDVFVLGGALMNENTAFRLADIRAAVERHRRVVPKLPAFRCASLGDQSTLYGAFALSQLKRLKK